MPKRKSGAAPPPLMKSVAKRQREIENQVIIVLEQASLETIQTSKGERVQLLNPDKHRDRILNSGRDISKIRPDILHQCLLMLLDSPLNRVGKLKVLIRTINNIIIEVSPKCRIPRTFDRFSGLMAQLLQKLSVSSSEGSHEKLLRVVKNPINIHFPPGSIIVGLSHSCENLLSFDELPNFESSHQSRTLVLVVGAIAHGTINSTFAEYLDHTISLSRFPLSAAQCCDRICHAFEKSWNVEEFLKE